MTNYITEYKEEKKVWISFEIDQEMWLALCKRADEVTLPNDHYIRALLHEDLKL